MKPVGLQLIADSWEAIKLGGSKAGKIRCIQAL
jgi:hypothetical protein